MREAIAAGLVDWAVRRMGNEIEKCASDEWFHGSKVALVSASESQPQLLLLAASLANRGFKIAAFDNAKLATNWLGEAIW